MATTTETEETNHVIEPGKPFFAWGFDKGISIRATWDPIEKLGEARHAFCSQGMDGAEIFLLGPSVPLQTIVHEVRHAIDWVQAMHKINGFEEAARLHGFIFEEIVAKFIRAGWVYGAKTSPGALFNTDIAVALCQPTDEPMSAEDELVRTRAECQWLRRQLATAREDVKLVELKGDDLLRQLLSYRRQLVEFDASEMARAKGGTAEDHYQAAHDHVNHIYGTKWKLRDFVDTTQEEQTDARRPSS